MRRRRGLMALVLLTLAIVGTFAVYAYAADAVAKPPAAEAERTRTLFDIINSGGVIGYFILFLDMIVIALAIEHSISIRRGSIMPPEVLSDIEECFEKREYENAIAVCEEQPTMFTNIVSAGLSRVNISHKQMDEAMAIAAEEGSVALQHKIGYLALIGNLGPMLGLMGTVVSMIEAFGKIAGSVAPKPAELADSIQLALVCTFEGLLTAVLAQAIFHFFKNKVQKVVVEVVAVSNELMGRFSPVE